MLPDGLTGFGSILDASWIGSIALVTGALPAEYGLRTVGLVDITTRPDIFNNSGQVSLYGGSQGTLPDNPVRRHVWQHLSKRTGASARNPTLCPVRIAFPACNISSPAAICRPTKASKIRPPPTARSTTSRNRRKASLICRLHRPVYAAQSDRRNLDQRVPNFQYSWAAGRLHRRRHERVRRHHIQFGAAQREPVRRHAIRRAGAARVRSTALTGRFLISLAMTDCITRRTRLAICSTNASPCGRRGATRYLRHPVDGLQHQPLTPAPLFRSHRLFVLLLVEPAVGGSGGPSTFQPPAASDAPALSPAVRAGRTGRSPTSSLSTAACASTKCGNSSAPTSSARRLELHLHTVRVHEVPRRVCPLLYPAGAGRGSSGQYRFVQQHHRGGT